MRANIHINQNSAATAFRAAALIAVLACAAAGCALFPAQSRPTVALTPLPTKEEPTGLAELKDIRSALNLAEKTIILVTSAPVKYTSYMLEKPPRLAVEMRQATSRISSAPIMVDDDLVERISVFEFRKAEVVRVEITLKRNAQHAVVTAENGIAMKIFPLEEQKDPALLAQRLMEAEAKAAALAAENEELKSILERQNEKLRENRDTMAKIGGSANGWEEYASVPGWKDKAKADILAVLALWRKSWAEKDFDTYSSLYSPRFQSGQMGRAKWLEQAKARFGDGVEETVSVFNRYVKIGKGSARVDFSAQFMAKDGAKETQKKTITLGWTPDGWKIESETGGSKP